MDDDLHWENDIDFSRPRKIHSNIYTRYPDKDLEDAFARLHGPDLYDDDDDDDETETTYNSHHSDKLLVREQCDPFSIPGLDDYMLGSPCSGVLTRIGTHKQVLDDGDWEEDIKLPSKGLPLKPFIKPSTVKSLNIPDEPPRQPFRYQQQQQQTQDQLDRKVRFLNLDQINTYTPENNEEEEENFDDIRFPDDMERLAIKRSTSPPPLLPLTTSSNNLPPLKQKSQERLTSKYSSSIENDDDDDFCKDLNIESDDVFQPKKKISTLPVPVPAPSISESKSRKPKSLIPRRTIQESKLSPVTSRSSTLAPSLSNRQQRSGFRAPTFASRQRQQIPTSNPRGSNNVGVSLPSTALAKHTLEKSQKPRRNKVNVANGTTLISRPQSSIKYGNGSELDNHDILPDWRRRTLSNRKILTEKANTNNADPQRPWRQSMAQRKLKLIRPNDGALKRECNNMKYDAEKQQWQGNEKNDLSFPSVNNNNSNKNPPSASSLPKQQHQQRSSGKTHQNKGHRLPALITNMNKKSLASKNAEVIVGTMVFDPIAMRWNKAPNLQSDNDDDPGDVLAHIEDLESSPDTSHNLVQATSRGGPNYQQDKTPEFNFSIYTKRFIHEQEEDHIQSMENWSQFKREEPVFFPHDKPVRSFTYLLYHPKY